MLLIGEGSQTSVPDDTLIVSKFNDVHVRIDAQPAIKKELSDFFTFTVPGHEFTPAYRNKWWDGKIRLFDMRGGKLYAGLVPYLQNFCNERSYDFQITDEYLLKDSFSPADGNDFLKSLNLPHKIRDYQLESFVHCVKEKRALILSPTASGKSLIIYLLAKWFGVKTLIIVPTTSLVLQMTTDFVSYGEDKKNIHNIKAGADKNTDCQFVVSTWQSLHRLNKDYFDQYDLVIGDECHLFKAKSLTTIMEKLVNCQYRFGFTGTLDGTQIHKLVLEGLFGPVKQFVRTKELMDSGTLAELTVKCLVLKYNKEDCKLVRGMKYQDEVDWIVRNSVRNKFIRNLALDLKGNSLVLFQFVEKHGKVLYDKISKKAEKARPVFFVSGATSAEDREKIRSITEKENNAIIVASLGTFSTGINIRNLHNVVFTSPTKSRIRNLQSIGRGLRKGNKKDKATLFDIADDLRHKSKVNYTLNHFSERVKIYNEEEFEYKIYNIKL